MEEEIKCHLCNGKAVLKFEELELDEGRIIIKDSPYYKCTKCKEEFATSVTPDFLWQNYLSFFAYGDNFYIAHTITVKQTT